jgi:RNA polymerase sigma-70 factor (ECF subfamily)
MARPKELEHRPDRVAENCSGSDRRYRPTKTGELPHYMVEMEANRRLETSTFDARYGELLADLRRVCHALGAGPDSEDIAQEVLVYGRSRLHQLRDDAKLRAWLRRMAVRNVLRQRPVQTYRSPTDISVDPDLALVDLGIDERSALAGLGERQRQLVRLVYFSGFRQDEVAEMLGISRGTVAKTLWNARRALARSLADYSTEAGR